MGHRSVLAISTFAVLLVACGAPGASKVSATSLITQGLKAQLSGDASTAKSDYLQAIHLSPNNDIAHFDLGTVYDQQRSTVLAEEEYQLALVIAPNFTNALFNLAVDTAGSNPPSAELLYTKVVTLQPKFAAAWLNLGFAVLAEGKTIAAQTDWAKAILLDPSLASRLPKTTPTPSAASSPKSSPTPK
jgi:Tfp pilus assembly protein PilF